MRDPNWMWYWSRQPQSMKMPLQRLEVVPITLDQMNGVMPQPLSPSVFQYLTRFEVEGQAKAVRCLWVRVVGGGHAQVHQAMHLCT